ncbi:MAG: FecR family protein [Cytophagales bacterium]|nr:MAG: FecR family protein [Cytophagales bacterium]
MTDYQTYDAEQLATDDWFCAWVLIPSPDADRFWTDWLCAHPDRANTVAQARRLTLALNEHFRQTQTLAPPDVVRAEANRIVELTQTDAENDEQTGRQIVFRPARRWQRWSVAASLLLLLGAGWFVWQSRTAPSTDRNSAETIAANPLVEHVNTTGQTASVLLPDGSMVQLEPGTRLSHPTRFVGNTRRVTLRGDAFFEVAHNSQQPFLITAGNTITRVVGTSFRILASTPVVTVAVRSGKVLVYRTDRKPPDDQPADDAVSLVANEQVTLGRVDVDARKEPVKRPEWIETKATQQEFSYDDAPLPVVLSALEKLYGITFEYDQTNLKDCPITCSFDEENFPERLDIICKSVGLTHEVRNGRVVLSGNGCH